MGRWTYYSPLWLGVLLVAALNDSLRALLPPMEPWVHWLSVTGIALIVGLQCQVLMTGAQGAFAQVLPVPVGRSIRGAGAALAGWLLIAWVLLSSVTVVLGYEAVTTAATALGVASLATLGSAVAVYVWSLPAAIADFTSSDRRAMGER